MVRGDQPNALHTRTQAEDRRKSLGLFLGWTKLLGLCWNKFPYPSRTRVQNTDAVHAIQNVCCTISILITTLHPQNCVVSGTKLFCVQKRAPFHKMDGT